MKKAKRIEALKTAHKETLKKLEWLEKELFIYDTKFHDIEREIEKLELLEGKNDD